MAIDDNTIYGLYGSQIKDLPEKINAVKGVAKVLTSADYNWPVDNPASVALWLLEPGTYCKNDASIIVRYGTTSASGSNESLVTFIVGKNNTTAHILVHRAASSGTAFLKSVVTNVTSGAVLRELNLGEINDTLTSTSVERPLSAKQGKVLKDFIGDLTNLTTTDKTNLVAAINEAAAGGGGGIIELTSADYDYPDDNPTGVALWRLDGGLYKTSGSVNCFISTSTTTNPSSGETILILKAPSSNPSYVRTFIMLQNPNSSNLPGTYLVSNSGSDVLSGNKWATLSNIYADPSTKEKIRIGAGANTSGASGVCIGKMANNSFAAYGVSVAERASVTGSYGVAIGYSSLVNDNFGVAIGSYSHATQRGQFDISSSGSGGTTYGYNGSQYRLLTGLYDPQSAHDAATKGYVDNSLLGKQDALTAGSGITIADESGSLVISATGSGGLDPNTTFWGQTASNGAVAGRITFGTNGYVNGTNSTVTVYADTAGGADPFEFSHTGLDVASKKITSLAAPTANGDAANKRYVDTAVSGKADTTYVDSQLSGKQDELTAGTGIVIAEESGALVISSTATEPDTFTTNEWNALWA